MLAVLNFVSWHQTFSTMEAHSFLQHKRESIEAPWLYDTMLTLAKTRAPMSQAKAGVTMGAIVVAAPVSKQ
jgi:hypothetical protein